MKSNRDFYNELLNEALDILGLDDGKNHTLREIERSYKTLMATVHPDHNMGLTENEIKMCNQITANLNGAISIIRQHFQNKGVKTVSSQVIKKEEKKVVNLSAIKLSFENKYQMMYIPSTNNIRNSIVNKVFNDLNVAYKSLIRKMQNEGLYNTNAEIKSLQEEIDAFEVYYNNSIYYIFDNYIKKYYPFLNDYDIDAFKDRYKTIYFNRETRNFQVDTADLDLLLLDIYKNREFIKDRLINWAHLEIVHINNEYKNVPGYVYNRDEIAHLQSDIELDVKTILDDTDFELEYQKNMTYIVNTIRTIYPMKLKHIFITHEHFIEEKQKLLEALNKPRTYVNDYYNKTIEEYKMLVTNCINMRDFITIKNKYDTTLRHILRIEQIKNNLFVQFGTIEEPERSMDSRELLDITECLDKVMETGLFDTKYEELSHLDFRPTRRAKIKNALHIMKFDFSYANELDIKLNSQKRARKANY